MVFIIINNIQTAYLTRKEKEKTFDHLLRQIDVLCHKLKGLGLFGDYI